jgi:4-alpha-glucanotransferase
MKFKRASGILLHPTSLPGQYGIGDIGPQAHHWIDYLSSTGCGLWQVLPLGPTGYGDSPYQSFSSFAGNPYLISPETLIEDGLLKLDDLAQMPDFSPTEVDYGSLIPWKMGVLNKAYQRFVESGNSQMQQKLEQFRTQKADWLDDFALFMAIKEALGGVSWSEWPRPLRLRDPYTMHQARQEYKEVIERQVFFQFIFFRQWSSLKAHAGQKGIQIIGDIPIFVAHDSADVWANTDLFYMDSEGHPTVVAGVPPDYFSPTGQLWGNPLYRWDVHKANGYSWWLNRLRGVLEMVDIVRLDHFRGFAGYWEVPAGNPTAEFGHWVAGPREKFIRAVRDSLGDLPIIAEDLGVITDDVLKLLDKFELPGMKVFQFAFLSDPSDIFMPHNYPQNCAAYTGTHDNDTTLGWFRNAPESEQDFCLRYLDLEGEQGLVWRVIRTVWGTVAAFTLAPMQDFLEMGSEARMNLPGNPSGNWRWRMARDDMSDGLRERIKEINYLYYRDKSIVKDEPGFSSSEYTQAPDDYPD